MVFSFYIASFDLKNCSRSLKNKKKWLQNKIERKKKQHEFNAIFSPACILIKTEAFNQTNRWVRQQQKQPKWRVLFYEYGYFFSFSFELQWKRNSYTLSSCANENYVNFNITIHSTSTYLHTSIDRGRRINLQFHFCLGN